MTTIEERCEVLFDLVGASALGKDTKKRLWDLIDEVEEGALPPAILTGVALAIVGDTQRLWSIGRCADRSAYAVVLDGSGVSHKAQYPECAVALALVEAGVVERT